MCGAVCAPAWYTELTTIKMDSRRSDVGSLDSCQDSMSISSSAGISKSHEPEHKLTTMGEFPNHYHNQPTSSHHDSYSSHNNPNDNFASRDGVTADHHILATTHPTITEKALKIATDVALVIQQVFPSLDFANSPQWMKNLVNLLANVLADSAPDTRNSIVQKLRSHLHQTPEKNLSVDLVAASALQLHPLLTEREAINKNVPVPNILPSLLRNRVATGLFVPIAHLLYGEALMLGNACHVLPNGEEAQPDPYPLPLDEPPPDEFVNLIKRVDILRGLSTHAHTLSQRFPGLAGDMHGLTRHMSILLFANKLPAAAAMELYNAFFKEFERQLGLLTVMPIDQFPTWLVESVVGRYKQASTSHSAILTDLQRSSI